MASLKMMSIRLTAERAAALDALVVALGRDRATLVNEAIDAFVAVHRQPGEVAGVPVAKGAGAYTSEDDVADAFARWIGRRPVAKRRLPRPGQAPGP